MAITDPYWWGSLVVLEHIAEFLRHCHHWAEWCPCHEDLVEQLDQVVIKLRQELLRCWSSCPLRGCRAPCLAAGEFFSLLNRISEVLAAELSLGLPTDITEAQKLDLISEFNLARNHLIFYFTLKLSHWTSPPPGLHTRWHMQTRFLLWMHMSSASIAMSHMAWLQC